MIEFPEWWLLPASFVLGLIIQSAYELGKRARRKEQ